MPLQPKNTVYKFLDSPAAVVTVPFDQTGTGTISTQGKNLVGSGTSFKSVLSAGAWIFNGTDEVRQVIQVLSDTTAVLSAAFTTDLSSATFKFVSALDANAREISMLIPMTQSDGTTANTWGTIDGEDFPNGVPCNFSKANRENSSRPDMIDPVVLDVTSTQCIVTIQYQ